MNYSDYVELSFFESHIIRNQFIYIYIIKWWIYLFDFEIIESKL